MSSRMHRFWGPLGGNWPNREQTVGVGATDEMTDDYLEDIRKHMEFLGKWSAQFLAQVWLKERQGKIPKGTHDDMVRECRFIIEKTWKSIQEELNQLDEGP
jgi:hypothetical protein